MKLVQLNLVSPTINMEYLIVLLALPLACSKPSSPLAPIPEDPVGSIMPSLIEALGEIRGGESR